MNETMNGLTASMVVFGLACAAAVGACTGDLGGSRLDSSGPNTGQGAAGGGDFGGFNPGGGNDGAGGEEACAELSVEATLVPVSMFIAVDKSGSMGNDNKWTNARAAFTTFFTDPEADNLNVALRFWPDGACDTSCNVAGCAQPQVPLGSLADPAHEQALVDIFNQKSPGGLTPMEAALAGAEEFAINQQTTAEAGEKLVVILLTDGEPTACSEDINVIASHASNAYAQAEILTFAVGLQGSNEAQMNSIAAAGQTGSGYFIGNGNAADELLQALKDIQQIAVACTFAMPESPDPTMPIDPNQVNIYYTASPGAEPELVKQVGGPDECGTEGGWYYDDPSDPSIIELCEQTCDAANAEDGSGIEITVGCKTVVQ